MRRAVLLTTLFAALAVSVPAAHSGGSIPTAPVCADSYLYFAPGISLSDYRASVLCLVNGARKAQGLPALTRSAPLERVGQQQAATFAATGRASHGRSFADIGRRFSRRGYRPAAFDEAFAVRPPGASPYAFLSEMLSRRRSPCSQILDPRFRDAGIGVSAKRGVVTTLAVELGLRAGARRPSANRGAARSCPHRVPAPVVAGAAVSRVGAAIASDTTVTLQLRCLARATCTFVAKLTLAAADAASPFQPVSIAAKATKAVVFTFDPAAIQAQLAAPQSDVSLLLTLSEPAQYTDTLPVSLSAG
ncbi:MAG TPA: CAP domain-containing protein [Solirubrobacteraceae bacterium]|nr:CAP domain-containing protein [Solirubrobacteraceae bacterium]